MIENVNEEKLKVIFEKFLIPNSSIGVHGILRGNHREIACAILEEGLREASDVKGLTGTITFYSNDKNLYHNVLEYGYGGYDENNNIYTVICAIPQIMEDESGKKYYLGEYRSFSKFGKDDYAAHTMPTHDLEKLPAELIVGYVETNTITGKNKFVINPKYLSLLAKEEQKNFCNGFLEKLDKSKLLSFDEKTYENVKGLYDLYKKSGLDRGNNYYSYFIEKYEELNKKQDDDLLEIDDSYHK